MPADVEAACDLIDAVAAKTPGTSIERTSGVVSDEDFDAPVHGCRVQISGSFAEAGAAGPVDGLAERFTADGWRELLEHAADGKDGSAFAFRRGDVTCHVRGRWNGGADGEPEIPPEDWFRVTAVCAR